ATSKNIGDQIRDAIQEAIDKQDYSNLQNVVGQSIGSATEAIGEGLRQAAQAAQVAQDKANRQVASRTAAFQREREIRRQQEQAFQQQVREQSIVSARFGNEKKEKIIAWVLAIVGGFVLGTYGICTLVAIPFLIASLDAAGIAAFILLAALTVGGGAMLRIGVKKIGLLKRFRIYRNVLGSREFCRMEELCRQSSLPQESVVADLRKLIVKDMLKHGHIDDECKYLMVTDEAYSHYRTQLNALHQRQQQQRLEQQRTAQRRDDLNMSPQARAILDKGQAFIRQIRKSNEAIPGAEISEKIDQIESVVRSIFDRAEENPQVIPELDRLMDYYLPTTVKLLDAYEDLDRQPVQGANIVKSKQEIEQTLDTLSVAFTKLLDSIFAEVAWDVSTDVSVLHAVLAQEGLVDNPFEKKPKGVELQF
ncbi:MAG: 5-bromo-4-chloroindolyl phosphate hydrolysis family protein, partial [Coriobacteriaceae bacterium]|nr:5-bromo-4-chloroindolyl phosphate hydrolysis family protein [Coriobacteriaceae bacterium]